MKKNDIASIFTDIDDEFIASAKPMAQKPIELRPEPRSKSLVWKKCAAAAACLAVVAAAGSVIAIKVGNPRQAAGPGSSGEAVLSNENLSTGDPLKQAENMTGLPTVGLDSDWYRENHETDSWHNDSEIHFYGVDYKVLNSKEFDGVKFLVGSDQVKDMIEFVAAVENTTDKPIMLYVPYSRDSDSFSNIIGTHTEIAVNIEKDGVKLCDADADEDHFTDDRYLLVVQPGETYYQRMRFDTYHGRYCEIGSGYTPVPEGIYNGTATVSLVSDSGEVTEHTLDFSVNIGGKTIYELASRYNFGDEFEYNGKTYRIINHMMHSYDDVRYDPDYIYRWSDFVVGVRSEIIDGQNTVEFAAFVENNNSEPIGVLGTAPGEITLFKFDIDDGSFGDEIQNGDEKEQAENMRKESSDFKYLTIIQPGEKCYQTASFPVTEHKYLFSTTYYHPDFLEDYIEKGSGSIGGGISYKNADFTGTGANFKDIVAYSIFGKDTQAVNHDNEFGGYDDDPGFSN